MLILFLLSSIIHQDTTLILKPTEKAFKVKIVLTGEVSILKGKSGKIRIRRDYPDSLKEEFKIISKKGEIDIGFLQDSVEIENYEIKKEKGKWKVGIGGDTVGRCWKDIKPLKFKIWLPKDISLDLRIWLGQSKNDIELGGLRIKRLDYNLGMGEGKVSFKKENRETMDNAYFNIFGAKLKIERLGNANPEKVEINGGVAKLKLDLGGKWKKESEIELSFALGNVGIKAPKELKIATEKEGIVNLDFPKLSSKDPRVRLCLKGAFNLLDFERY